MIVLCADWTKVVVPASMKFFGVDPRCTLMTKTMELAFMQFTPTDI